MKANFTEEINLLLRKHQRRAKDWKFNRAITVLHKWAKRMIANFHLGIGIPALMIERLGRKLGRFTCGRNPFGLRDEIAIDEGALYELPLYMVIVTVLHELVHSWQEHHGMKPRSKNPHYHNAEFRQKARSLGLLVGVWGHTQCTPGNTPLLNLFKKYGFKVPEIPEPKPFPQRQRRLKFKGGIGKDGRKKDKGVQAVQVGES
jgi:hypothetical protein